MDLNAYHRAWMSGATEEESVQAGEEAFFENMLRSAADKKGYEMMEREAYEHEQRLIEEREVNKNDAHGDGAPNTNPSQGEGYPPGWWHCTIHLNPNTGEIHSDGDHRVRAWIQEQIRNTKELNKKEGTRK